MHYNEGWGWNVHTERTCRNQQWSDRFKIKYCEIWNEPDLDYYDNIESNRTPRCWGGTVTNYFELYDIASKYLKKRFPAMKIGGPALAVLVTRFSDDRNVTDTGKLVLRLPGRKIGKAFAYVTDLVRTYTEVPLLPQPDGSAVLMMQPLSFALIELPER